MVVSILSVTTRDRRGEGNWEGREKGVIHVKFHFYAMPCLVSFRNNTFVNVTKQCWLHPFKLPISYSLSRNVYSRACMAFGCCASVWLCSIFSAYFLFGCFFFLGCFPFLVCLLGTQLVIEQTKQTNESTRATSTVQNEETLIYPNWKHIKYKQLHFAIFDGINLHWFFCYCYAPASELYFSLFDLVSVSVPFIEFLVEYQFICLFIYRSPCSAMLLLLAMCIRCVCVPFV